MQPAAVFAEIHARYLSEVASVDLDRVWECLGLAFEGQTAIIILPAPPKAPLRMLFNDRHEAFPAHCSLLFEKRAGACLDMEWLAMLGMVLAARLGRSIGQGVEGAGGVA